MNNMIDTKTGEPITSHSTFDVPIIVVSDRVESLKSGKLADVSPTMCQILGIEKAAEMTGEGLLTL